MQILQVWCSIYGLTSTNAHHIEPLALFVCREQLSLCLVVAVKADLSLGFINGTGFPLDNTPSTTQPTHQEHLFHKAL